MSARDRLAGWLRDCAARIAPPAPPAPAPAPEPEPDDGLTIPPPPAAPPPFATPGQIRDAMNRRLIQQARKDRDGVVSIEHLGRIS